MIQSLSILLLGWSWSVDGSCSDPLSCRMIVTSNSVYALTQTSMTTIQMKYDLALDPVMQNKVNSWDKGVDVYGKTSYGNIRISLNLFLLICRIRLYPQRWTPWIFGTSRLRWSIGIFRCTTKEIQRVDIVKFNAVILE